MILQYTFLEEDLVESQRFHIAGSPAVRRRQRLGMIIVSAVIMLACLISAGDAAGKPSRPSMLILGIVLSAVMCLWLRFSHQRNSRNLVRAMLKEGSTDGMFGPQEIEIDDSGISKRSDVRGSFAAWSVVRRLDETDTHVFVYVSSIEAHVIPKNRVTSGDLSAFINTVRDRVAENNSPF